MGGFLITEGDLPPYLIWAYHLSYTRYAMEGFTVNELEGLHFHCTPSQVVHVPVFVNATNSSAATLIAITNSTMATGVTDALYNTTAAAINSTASVVAQMWANVSSQCVPAEGGWICDKPFCPITRGDDLIKGFDMESNSRPMVFGVLVGYYLALMVVFLLAIKFIVWQKR